MIFDVGTLIAAPVIWLTTFAGYSARLRQRRDVQFLLTWTGVAAIIATGSAVIDLSYGRLAGVGILGGVALIAEAIPLAVLAMRQKQR